MNDTVKQLSLCFHIYILSKYFFSHFIIFFGISDLRIIFSEYFSLI